MLAAREQQESEPEVRRRTVVNGPSSNGGVRMRERTQDESRIVSLAQARRHHIRQQLTAQEREEFDEQYGEEDEFLFEDEVGNRDDGEEDEEFEEEEYDDDH